MEYIMRSPNICLTGIQRRGKKKEGENESEASMSRENE